MKCIGVVVCPPRPQQGLIVDPANKPLPPEPPSSSSSSSTEESDIDIPLVDGSDSSLDDPKFEPKLPSVGCRAPAPLPKDIEETKPEAGAADEKKEGNGHAPYETNMNILLVCFHLHSLVSLFF